MIIRSVHIDRKGQYSFEPVNQSIPFIATIMLDGKSGKIELLLSEELSRRIMEVVADEVVAASRATAEAMTAEILDVAALPAPAAS
jgi:hypothetical protein